MYLFFIRINMSLHKLYNEKSIKLTKTQIRLLKINQKYKLLYTNKKKKKERKAALPLFSAKNNIQWSSILLQAKGTTSNYIRLK